MKRKIYNKLLEWKNTSNGKTALLIEGARRVGKSYITLEFAKNNYKSYLLIDFAFAPDRIKKLFYDYGNDLDILFMYLSEFYHTKLYERDTLFIFDEVQFCPRERSLIKYLVADGRYDYIETGSLISIQKNVKDILNGFYKKGYNEKKPLGELLHRKVMDYYKQYLIVSGLPQVV